MRAFFSLLVITLLALNVSTAQAACETGTVVDRLDCLSRTVTLQAREINRLQTENAELRSVISIDASANTVTFDYVDVVVDGGSFSGGGGIASGDESFAWGNNVEASGFGSVAIGGGYNDASGDYSVAIGGGYNDASGESSVVVGGSNNIASALVSSVFGGGSNEASGDTSVVVAGIYNLATGYSTAIFGGNSNEAVGQFSVIIGGVWNTASYVFSLILGSSNQVDSTTYDVVSP